MSVFEDIPQASHLRDESAALAAICNFDVETAAGILREPSLNKSQLGRTSSARVTFRLLSLLYCPNNDALFGRENAWDLITECLRRFAELGRPALAALRRPGARFYGSPGAHEGLSTFYSAGVSSVVENVSGSSGFDDYYVPESASELSAQIVDAMASLTEKWEAMSRNLDYLNSSSLCTGRR